MNTVVNNNGLRQISTIPPVIRKEQNGKKLSIFRVKRDGNETYHLENGDELFFVFTSWQFHVLSALFSFGGDKYPTLLVNVNDRFGLSLGNKEIDLLFEEIKRKQLFDENNAPGHPLIKPFLQSGKNKAGFSADNVIPLNNNDNQSNNYFAEPLVNEAKEKKYFHLFNPTKFFKKSRSFLSISKYALYPLPFFLCAALFILFRNSNMVGQDVLILLKNFNIVIHLIFGFFWVNSLEIFATAAIAYSYGATVNSISVHLLMGFIPRFYANIEDTEKCTMREKMWIHSALLIMSLWLFSVGIFVWYHFRPVGHALSDFGETVAWVSAFSFLISACPFYKANGYYILTEFLNEPNLREKAFKEFMNRWHKNSHVTDYNNVLLVYFVAFVIFTLTFFILSYYLIYSWLHREVGTNISSNGILIMAVAVIYGGYKFYKEIKKINESYKSSMKLERWRMRVLPQEEKNNDLKAGSSSKSVYIIRAALITVILVLPLPYPYQPSGQVVMLPITQQQISTDITGVISEVYYDGGEVLEKGTLIARLSVSDYESHLKVEQANYTTQEAVVTKLKSFPTKEQVDVANERLGVAKMKSKYSNEKCIRERQLYKSGAISLSAMQDIEKASEVDKQEVLEAEADLKRVMAGTPPEEIAAAEAALLPIQAQINLYQNQINRSEFKMPFTGKLATLYLKEKQGHYLERGAPLATAQDDGIFKAELDVPETDLKYLHEGVGVEVDTIAYPNKPFKGIVKIIHPEVVTTPNGNMVKMIFYIDNNDKDRQLKSGMTGYAKVDAVYKSVWNVLSDPMYRFLTVDVWAWIP